jgi:hypothetical protein
MALKVEAALAGSTKRPRNQRNLPQKPRKSGQRQN